MMASAKKWMGVTLVATLVIGMGAGVLVDRFLLASTLTGLTGLTGSTVHSRARGVDRSRGGEHSERGRRMVERLRSGLDLTDDQAARLEEVMNRNHETAHQYWKDSRQEYETIRQQFRADIRELLNEEQQGKFDQMVAEYEAKSHRDREGRRSAR